MAIDKEAVYDMVRGLSVEETDWLLHVVRSHQSRLAIELRRELAIGDEVVFADTVRPRMLAGRKAIVRSVWRLDKRVVVDLVNPIGRWSTGVRTDPALLRKVGE